MKTKILALLCAVLMCSSCKDYLDIVPDNVATLDHAFTNMETAEKFLFTCYSYMPNPADVHNTPAFVSGFESWSFKNNMYYFQLNGSATAYAYQMAAYGQTSESPYFNNWSGGNGGTNLWIAIRDCNIFMQNIHKPTDLSDALRTRWIAEVKFLKAYYHYLLLRQYGPIPIMKDNIDVSASLDEVRVYREPVDVVVQYISDLLDECIPDLPSIIQNETEEMGRITQAAAATLKAQVWLLSASPIFNGNSYYAYIKDNRGQNLFNSEFDVSKWEKAAEAAKDAIETAEGAGIELYTYDEFSNYTDSTKLKLALRFRMTKKWNSELIWGSTRGTTGLQQLSAVRTKSDELSSVYVINSLAPTFATVERYYTNNGVPINEDKTWDYRNRYSPYEVESDERFYMKEGYITGRLNHAREPRFYSDLTFDGSLMYGKGFLKAPEKDFYVIQMKKGEPGGVFAKERHSCTGYLPKKVLNVETTWDKDNRFTNKEYSFPIMRLADVYLMYAEALNEVAAAKGEAVPEDVYYYIDQVRERAGLKGVKESWAKYSKNPNKPNTPEGMREIIQQERLIELAFEGKGYWDILRWKRAEKEFNQPIYGWNVMGATPEEYYVRTEAEARESSFSIKDYLTPLSLYDLDRNPNLVQNYGW